MGRFGAIDHDTVYIVSIVRLTMMQCTMCTVAPSKSAFKHVYNNSLSVASRLKMVPGTGPSVPIDSRVTYI